MKKKTYISLNNQYLHTFLQFSMDAVARLLRCIVTCMKSLETKLRLIYKHICDIFAMHLGIFPFVTL